MNEVIYWLMVNLLITGLMWIPYILNRLVIQGPSAMGYSDNLPPVSQWAIRAQKAHSNSVENLTIFAPAVLGFIMLEGASFETIQCAMGIYMFSRITHYVCFTCKVPYLRTLSFAVNWASTMYIIFQACLLASQ